MAISCKSLCVASILRWNLLGNKPLMETISLYAVYCITMALTWLCFLIGIYIHRETRTGNHQCKYDGVLYKGLLLLPLVIWSGYGKYSVSVADSLQLARAKSTPVMRELQYVTEIATVSLPSGRTVSYSRLQRVAGSSGCSGVRTGESRDYTERASVPASGLSKGWVISDDAKL